MPTEPTTCPYCHGSGEIGTWVQWSDGLGGSSAQCPVCDGNKAIDFDPVQELAQIKTRLAHFLYKVWLASGCNILHESQSGLQPHEQSLRNEVLRLLKEFPESTHSSCDVKNKYQPPPRVERRKAKACR